MKNSILFMFVLALFTFGCSNDEITDVQDDNTSNRIIEFNKTINELVNNNEFINLVSPNAQQRNNSDNGVIVIEDETSIFFGVVEFPMVYLFSENFNDDYVALMPNGNARFFAHSNNPLAAVIDLSMANPVLGNSCIDGRIGRLNANLMASDWEVQELPFGTMYTINQASTASVLVGHSELSDAQFVTLPEEEPYCTEATMNVTLHGRVIFRNNNNGETGPNINFNIH